ncbi:hypothetical protein ACH36K_16735 [Clostridium sp. MB05]|uniref:hypothetical protein n=1 Tax=Clostridium sp. MB05 TaxID=3376682 RepID=UPI003982BC61
MRKCNVHNCIIMFINGGGVNMLLGILIEGSKIILLLSILVTVKEILKFLKDKEK